MVLKSLTTPSPRPTKERENEQMTKKKWESKDQQANTRRVMLYDLLAPR